MGDAGGSTAIEGEGCSMSDKEVKDSRVVGCCHVVEMESERRGAEDGRVCKAIRTSSSVFVIPLVVEDRSGRMVPEGRRTRPCGTRRDAGGDHSSMVYAVML